MHGLPERKLERALRLGTEATRRQVLAENLVPVSEAERELLHEIEHLRAVGIVLALLFTLISPHHCRRTAIGM